MTVQKHDHKTCKIQAERLLIGAVAVVLGLTCFAGCGEGGESKSVFKAPASFTANEQSVSTLVTEAINKEGSSPGLASPPQVNCSSSECTITYITKSPTGLLRPPLGKEQSYFNKELIQPTRQIWKALFEDSNIKKAKIMVGGPVALNEQESARLLYSLECSRENASQINWDASEANWPEVEAYDLKKICKYHQAVKP
jgi:hypothetical protein